jgi:ATP phosphoribosyltransferase regulatory subunit
MKRDAWRLPEGIDEVLPPDAWALEGLRRRVLDLFDAWGYEFVMPPLVEYLDALLVGSGTDLELQTFRMVDQRSGRMLGIRADMTSQAARIDAASLRVDGAQRLCYAGTVVHANPPGVLESRIPLVAGAELFGAQDVEADAEVVALMVAVLRCAGLAQPLVELGHVGVFRSLVADGLLGGREDELFDALQRKSEPDIEAIVDGARMAAPVKRFLRLLPGLVGGDEVLAAAKQAAKRLPAATTAAIDELPTLAAAVRARTRELNLRFDLCELTGYGYHTGAVFTAYSPDIGKPIARGGRYDGVGACYGRARPATGFDVDLKRLPRAVAPRRAIWAPGLSWTAPSRRALLAARIDALRAAGERVVGALSAGETPAGNCDRALVWRRNAWEIETIARGATRHG